MFESCPLRRLFFGSPEGLRAARRPALHCGAEGESGGVVAEGNPREGIGAIAGPSERAAVRAMVRRGCAGASMV